MAIFSVEAISEITSINPKSCRMRKRKVCMVERTWQLLFRLVDCTGAGQHRNEDEEVITLGNTPEAWSWQTAADRS